MAADASQPTPEGQSTGFLMVKTVNILKAGLRRALVAAGYDLTPEQWGVLVFVLREPGLTQSDLAERTSKDKPTITRILDRLEKKGLLGRRQNARDRRSFTIYPTSRGVALHPGLQNVVSAYSEAVFGGLSQEDIDGLRRTFAHISERAGAA